MHAPVLVCSIPHVTHDAASHCPHRSPHALAHSSTRSDTAGALRSGRPKWPPCNMSMQLTSLCNARRSTGAGWLGWPQRLCSTPWRAKRAKARALSSPSFPFFPFFPSPLPCASVGAGSKAPRSFGGAPRSIAIILSTAFLRDFASHELKSRLW